ncbi:hypothetical protein WJX72_012048 [[Myrmecia] bisecta]|uniref:Protein arginine N-methyltransferase 2 n=1 Tax=[Myrmecia] bisecta TaxID=41462 RepID=A0AAW1PMN1_9CHLO
MAPSDDKGSKLMAAAAAGDTECLLLDAGAPWNAIDKTGKCAGDYAVEGGHEEAAEFLLEAGCRAELVLGLLERKLSNQSAASNNSYLQQRLQYDSERLMDAESKGVMMTWEGPLMEAHAQAICSTGGDVLNVGFGLGMVDEALQKRKPRSHTIIEAHPDVHAHMLQQGWADKPGVRIVFGRWQDVLLQLGQFDGIFFDTYGEYYEDLRAFHEHVPKLVRPGGVYSYFNGLAADNAFFHAVYCQIVKSEMERLGMATQFIPLPINVSDKSIWEGVKNRYWQLDTYFLPICQHDEAEEEQ